MSDSMIPSRRDVLATLAACGCCAAIGRSALAGPEDRLPPAKPGKNDVGALADFATDGIYDQHARTHQVLLVRASGTLYATTSICSHKRCLLKKKDDTATVCPCHESEFDTAGIPLNGPAKVSLTRYAITIESNRVFVDTTKSFAEKDWNEAAASVKVG